MKIIYLLIFILFLSVQSSESQYLKVENGYFRVANYKLIEDILTYRIYEYDSKICIRGGEMDYTEFYELNFISNKKGKYEIVIYLKPNRILIKEVVEVK